MAHIDSVNSFISQEIASQPAQWRTAAGIADEHRSSFPDDGSSVAVIGCGTSWFIAMAYAKLRESSGHGLTDAFAASEFPSTRADGYDMVIGITRSGTTTEVLDLFRRIECPTLAISAVADAPAVLAADDSIILAEADEKSIVQTRFATTALALFRASLGHDLEQAAEDAARALELDVDGLLDLEQVTFLGSSWTTGLAEEAALKCREAAQFWTESYPAMEYRHGPLAIAEPGRAVWGFGEMPSGLRAEAEATGATFVHHADLDPMAQLIVAQRFAGALATARGLNADIPRNLGRSVVLDTPT